MEVPSAKSAMLETSWWEKLKGFNSHDLVKARDVSSATTTREGRFD